MQKRLSGRVFSCLTCHSLRCYKLRIITGKTTYTQPFCDAPDEMTITYYKHFILFHRTNNGKLAIPEFSHISYRTSNIDIDLKAQILVAKLGITILNVNVMFRALRAVSKIKLNSDIAIR